MFLIRINGEDFLNELYRILSEFFSKNKLGFWATRIEQIINNHYKCIFTENKIIYYFYPFFLV